MAKSKLSHVAVRIQQTLQTGYAVNGRGGLSCISAWSAHGWESIENGLKFRVTGRKTKAWVLITRIEKNRNGETTYRYKIVFGKNNGGKWLQKAMYNEIPAGMLTAVIDAHVDDIEATLDCSGPF